MALLFMIVGFDHLTERAFPYERIDFVAIQEAFPMPDDVVVIVVVVAIIVHFAFFFVVMLTRILARRLLLRSSLLLGIVYLIDWKKSRLNKSTDS